MARMLSLSLAMVLLARLTVAAPTPDDSIMPPTDSFISPDPNPVLWSEGTDSIPTAVRGKMGASILGPQNRLLDLMNPDLLAPPSTDSGQVPNVKWPFSMSHNRLANGGWARQQNVNAMPAATAIAGVNMRLEPGVAREMHWHTSAEWAYMIAGDVRISVLTPEGQMYLADVTQGDLWYFPSGYPHSIQAKNTTADGAEFLLIFDEGNFSEDATFLLTDWLAHTPKDVIAKNFGMSNNLAAFDHIPERELYIFPSAPMPENVEDDMVVPNNTPLPFTFPLSRVNATSTPGGSVKVVDSRTFNVSKTISAVEVTVNPGGMRELHWHPTQPEWSYFLEGQARVTVFASEGHAQTYNFMPGDVGYIPPSFGHYVENTGNTTLKFLEIFKADIFQDISLNQWLALTPPELVKSHLGFDDDTISRLSKVKQEVV
ncbi:hypothetical protein PC9H_008695 [Pleurotus ostreatus]|uniref:Cupin type-1 domain-containing protein n=2 Tax=Pleurotus TaxID=5320 RepID=A0A8H6ZS87_PLEOS|nr:uncharacterized protein PC9H_008695 [Pleurotus ostreatus]KAF7426327.1 hypothetical protein PC9H_008695 [Pleurotus ostreatus]KAJ8693837.1 hypothetical protein PTI98_008792 [Pleurotus ostreatus]